MKEGVDRTHLCPGWNWPQVRLDDRHEGCRPGLPTKQLRVNLHKDYFSRYKYYYRKLTCTAKAVFPTPPSPRTATLQLSISMPQYESMNRVHNTPMYLRKGRRKCKGKY